MATGKMWFSIFDFSFDYKGDEPPYSSPDVYKWSAEFENNYAEIKEELADFLAQNELTSYFSASMVTKPGSWKTISLITWGIHMFKVKKHFPKICAVLNKYPEIVSASFSMLDAKSNILEHCGDTNAVYRCHLGIDVPAGLPECGIRVNGESRAWQNGKWFAFMDAYKHEAWNSTDKPRYVFIIDVMRPEFERSKSYVCATVRTSLLLQRRVKNLTKRPVFAKWAALLLRPWVQFGIFMANKIKYY